MIKVLDHFWLKITAVVLGLLLWIHVATEKVYNYELLLPLNTVVLSDNHSLAQAPPESLTVVVSATGKQLLRQKWRERGLRITATQLGAGRHRLELTTANTSLESPAGSITLQEIVSPSSVMLNVDLVAESRLPVIPDIDAEPDDGFVVSEIALTDEQEVTVSGPRSIISRMVNVRTEKKTLRGIRNNLNLRLAVAKPEGHGTAVRPDSVSVSVRVIPVKTRIFENVPVAVYNSPVGRSIRVEPPAVTVEVTGPPAEIDLLNRNALIVSADFSDLNAENRAPIKIDCPSKFKIRNSSTDSVTIRVQ
ncbi:MAG: hypothetical protein JSW34_02320 [Candidatus Zixiibacteriota bacterium]|nr:MAG: hypothetical protein JSW34_02320 [candidate division Zixibacteria bacterium]